jgi:hypothetical protein
MFVRWMRRRRYKRVRRTEQVSCDPCDWYPNGRRLEVTSEFETIGWTRYASLVESVRTQAGPRHKFITHLASIPEGRERDEDPDDGPRRRFWWRAARRLRDARIGRADLAKVVAALEAVVPLPDDWRPEWDRREIEDDAGVDALMPPARETP